MVGGSRAGRVLGSRGFVSFVVAVFAIGVVLRWNGRDRFYVLTSYPEGGR